MKVTSTKSLHQKKSSLNFLSNVNKAFDSFLNGNFHFSYGNKVLLARASDTLRMFSQTKSLSDSKLHRNMFLNYLINCERKAPGGAFAFLLYLLSDYEEFEHRRIDDRELSVLLSSYIGSGDIKNTVYSIINGAGYEFDLQYTSSRVDKLSVEIMGSHSIKAQLDVLMDSFTSKKMEASFYCVDGMIDTVGEIDALIRWSLDNDGANVVLIANSYNPDVVNTIKQNGINIFPFVFESQAQDDLPLLADKLCVPLISTQTGLRFANLDLDDYDKKQCTIKQNQIIIKNNSGESKSVLVHIPERLSDVRGIIEDRIKLGLLLVKNAALFGIRRLQSGTSVYYITNNAADFANHANENWNKTIDNIGCVIYTEST